MKKLIKISEFYYCIDTEAEVSINNIVWDSIHTNLKNNIIPNEDNSLIPSNGYYKVIATTNPALNLPIIQNIEECEELIDKEVDVKFETDFTSTYGMQDPLDEPIVETITIVKPIVKEMIPLESDFADTLDELYRSKIVKEETIKEAAEKYFDSVHMKKDSNYGTSEKHRKLFIDSFTYIFEAGVIWQKKQDSKVMYTKEEILKFVKESNGDLNNANTWIDWFENNKKK
jgi:hypothetical protein